jgi:hypothetical protein
MTNQHAPSTGQQQQQQQQQQQVLVTHAAAPVCCLCFVRLIADVADCNPLRRKHLVLPSFNDTAAASAANWTAAAPSRPAAAAVETPDEHAAVSYLQRAVFFDKTRMPRKPVENFWLQEPGATNQTFRDYRTKVAAYLNSTEFKQRWDALKQQVSALL